MTVEDDDARSLRPARGEGLTIEPVWEADRPNGAVRPTESEPEPPRRTAPLPPELAARYPGELSIGLHDEHPTIVANFVSSIDGVVALGRGEGSSGGSEISGHSEPDRFMMALLRGMADAVIVGAGTVRVGRNHEWTARNLRPDLAPAFAGWRSRLHLAPQPTTVVVTASGDIDLGHRGLSAPDVPVIVATTEIGAQRLADSRKPANLTIAVFDNGERVTPTAVRDILATNHMRLALCEGGPHLFSKLLAEAQIDELFLTLAPRLAGRPAGGGRLGLVEGADMLEAGGRWTRLTAIRHAGDDLFLRYRFDR